MILQITPNLTVDRIEPSVSFWTKLGFTLDVQVPEGDHMGFAILVKGKNQVMYQTRESLQEDSAGFDPAAMGRSPAMLFITVPDIKAVLQALDGHDVVVPLRETFYGSTEITYCEPGGHFVTLAQFAEETAD